MFINASNAVRAFVGLMALGLAAACGSDNSTTAPSTTSGTMPTNSATVTIPASSSYGGMFSFAPATVTINVGGTVTWKNNDSVTHSSTSDSPGWDLTMTTGSTVTQTFTTAGTFPYHCRLHSMTGTVIVQ